MNTAKLYEIANNLEWLIDFEPETPEDLAAQEELIAEVVVDFKQKINSCCGLVAQFKDRAAAFRARASQFERKARIEENKADWLSDYIMRQMEAVNSDRVIGATWTAKIVATPPKVVIDENAIIPEVYLVQQDPRIDKKAIAAALKGGIEIPGVHFQKGFRLDIK